MSFLANEPYAEHLVVALEPMEKASDDGPESLRPQVPAAARVVRAKALHNAASKFGGDPEQRKADRQPIPWTRNLSEQQLEKDKKTKIVL